MIIGIDLSVLQMDHRYRGIGSVVVNFINNLSEQDKKEHSFVFFVETKDEELAYEQLDLQDISYQVAYLHNKDYKMLPGALSLFSKALYKIVGFTQYYTGDPRISRSQLKEMDRFIQFDQNRKLPRLAKKKAVLFLHDLIPYVMESDYLWTYSTARLNGRSRKGSVKFAFQRFQYAARLKISTRRARTLIANSQHTKKDFVNYLNVTAKKVHVAHLGINIPSIENNQKPTFHEYKSTMWGTVKKSFDPSIKPYLFFTGGMDHRRKIVELLAAYNNLKARGENVSLIISGDTVEGIRDIRNTVIREYLENNLSYIDDIHLIGYADNRQRDWLYAHATAFVFPSVYEGFGLPVLEAMSYGAPVITYNNTSIKEVAGKNALYVEDFLGIAEQSTQLLHSPDEQSALRDAGRKHSANYTWTKTKSAIIKALEI